MQEISSYNSSIYEHRTNKSRNETHESKKSRTTNILAHVKLAHHCRVPNCSLSVRRAKQKERIDTPACSLVSESSADEVTEGRLTDDMDADAEYLVCMGGEYDERALAGLIRVGVVRYDRHSRSGPGPRVRPGMGMAPCAVWLLGIVVRGCRGRRC